MSSQPTATTIFKEFEQKIGPSSKPFYVALIVVSVITFIGLIISIIMEGVFIKGIDDPVKAFNMIAYINATHTMTLLCHVMLSISLVTREITLFTAECKGQSFVFIFILTGLTIFLILFDIAKTVTISYIISTFSSQALETDSLKQQISHNNSHKKQQNGGFNIITDDQVRNAFIVLIVLDMLVLIITIVLFGIIIWKTKKSLDIVKKQECTIVAESSTGAASTPLPTGGAI